VLTYPFRNYEIQGNADRTMIYLTLYAQLCIRECERINNKSDAKQHLVQLAMKQYPSPGSEDWKLGALLPKPENNGESEKWTAYMRQCREEVSNRVVNLLYKEDGTQNKWWFLFGVRSRKFMQKEITKPVN